MGSMHATCGHEISWEWLRQGQGSVWVKDFSREGTNAASYRVLCPECLINYEKSNRILHNEEEKGKWLGIKGRKKNELVSNKQKTTRKKRDVSGQHSGTIAE